MMRKFFVYFLAFVAMTTVVSCDDKDEPTVELSDPTFTWEVNPDFDTLDITEKMDVKIQVNAPAGIKTFKVIVKSAVLNEKGITEIDLIEPSENVEQYMDVILGEAGSPKDKTSYLLDLSQFVPMINTLTYEDSDHTFTIRVWDKNNQMVTQTAVFHRVVDLNKATAALKVNMFTKFNVKSIDNKIVTFYNKLENTNEDNNDYFSYNVLKGKGLTNSDGTEILQDADGKKYRIPTTGEMELLVVSYKLENPYMIGALWAIDGKYSMKEQFSETIYLKNGSDNKPDKETNAGEIDGDYCISGQSWLKRGVQNDSMLYESDGVTYHLAPVYGLRFQGTSQCAAYRWEYARINDNPQERYLSIKIKALGKNDKTTTIDEVARESFWTDGYIEFNFPASGVFIGSKPLSGNNRQGNYVTSTLSPDLRNRVRVLSFIYEGAYVTTNPMNNKMSLRLVKVEE